MAPIRALILDFDGVILESNDAKTRAFAAVFSRFPEHAQAMMAYHEAHVSDSRFAKFQYLAVERLGRPSGDPLVDELAAVFSDEVLRQVVQCPMVPGAKQFLDAVHGQLPVFLASVTPQDELEAILGRRGLSQHFTRVYGCPPWTKIKAVADIVETLHGVDGVLFVGDSVGDQRAARDVGVEFLARDSGLPFDDPAPPRCRDLAQLLETISPRLRLSVQGLL